jgi:serine protease Do
LLAESFGLAQSTGALVVNVDPDSPARRAGLAAGDIVTAIDGARFAHFSELLQQIAGRTPGTRSRLELWRRGETHTIWVTLSEQPGARLPSPVNSEPEWNDGLGLSLGELSAGTRQKLRIDAALLVRESSGLARSEGIRAGDLIIAVNDQRLERVEDFRRALSRVKTGRTVALLVMRDRRLAYVPIKISARSVSH